MKGWLSVAVSIWLARGQHPGPYTTELYETCTAEQGFQARCGPGANCLIMGGVPTCHCIIDMATGLRLAGNPYRACTYDLSGKWAVESTDEGKNGRWLNDPFSNEPFIIRIDRTDAILKTQYMTGAIFVITAITGAASGICARVYVNVDDNQSVIFELAEGFVDGPGRQMYFRNRRSDAALSKKWPKYMTNRDRQYLWGAWRKWEGSKVKIYDFKRSKHQASRYRYGNSAVLTPGWAYWFDDDSFGAPAARLSTALFLDDTLPFERAAFDTNNRFIQLGWFGYLSLGASAISIISPADGKEIFVVRRIQDWNLPVSNGPQSTVLTLTGEDQIRAIMNAAQTALTPVERRLASTHNNTYVNVNQRPRDASDDAGVFTSADRLREMGVLQAADLRSLKQVAKMEFPTPERLQVPAMCPVRNLGELPKATLDDLKQFSTLGKKESRRSGASKKVMAAEETFPKVDDTDRFDLEDVDGSPYNFLWRGMAIRLAEASEIAANELTSRVN